MMTKRTKSPTRAEKIAVSKAAVKPKSTPRRQGTTKTNPEVPVEQSGATVTSMVARAGKPRLIAGFAQLVAHRKPVVEKVKTAIAAIDQSYAEHDKNDRDAHFERRDLADDTLDWVMDCFDHNGFSNPGDRLVFAWLMLDLLRPIGHRTEEVLDLIEKTFGKHHQVLTEHGLGLEIKRRRDRQEKRRAEQKQAA